jgi:hypothetical protein
MYERVPEFPAVDPILARAREKAAREVANKEHKKLTAKTERAHRQAILTKPYESSPSMMDLLNQCVRVTPAVECNAQDYRIVAKMGRTAADDFLSPHTLSDTEAVVILQFMNVQLPPIWPDGNAWLTCMDILHLENIIRPAIFNQPVEAEPEPEQPEQCPFVYGSREQESWDRAQYRKELNAEISPEFRRGAMSLQLEQALTPADMKRLMVALESMKLPLTAPNVRRAGIQLYGELVTNLTPEEQQQLSASREIDAMTSAEMKSRFGFVNSYAPRGAPARPA